MQQGTEKQSIKIVLIGGLIVTAILVLGTIWMGRSARTDNEKAVRTVSLMYLDELAGRREQVVSENLKDSIDNLETAINLMTAGDLKNEESLKEYQSRMRKLYNLEKFAFVNEDGLIYTADGTKDNIADYSFDYKTISGPEISILNLNSPDKKVIIAVPVQLEMGRDRLVACFMEIDMGRMLEGVSLSSSSGDTTFCNIYTADGVALTNTVLGGLAEEDNLIGAMERAEFEEGYSYESFTEDFRSGKRGEVSFTYNDIRETLSFVPIDGTDWRLTYLIRESVISEQIDSISQGVIIRSIIQSILTIAVLVIIFSFVISQIRQNAKLRLEKETADTESRIKEKEYERRLSLQQKLIEQEHHREEQDKLITALASDYWSVYYVELDSDRGVCYQEYEGLPGGLKDGESFDYLETFKEYAENYVTDQYRDEFLSFIRPETVKSGLLETRVISYRYMVRRDDKETYEMIKFAGVRHPEDRDDHIVHSVGVCITDVDAETRQSMDQSSALSDALNAAEQASKAKTVFLSNMSHEIRTPMNAIIGLDNIALNDPETPEKTKEYLTKIGASAEHLLGLINDILDMSRIESGKMILKNEEFSFPRLLESINTIFSSQCQNKGIDYQCYINGRIDDYYFGDNMKLRQVLINILGNAVKFTDAGGKVQFSVEKTAAFDGKSTLRFTVSDTGIGMSEDYIPHIFDTFSQENAASTNKYGSSGLGLAITKNIIEMMNGNITVKSRKGEGSTFIVTVTLTDSDRNDESKEFEINPSDMSVLIVDDDPVACEHAAFVLDEAGIASEAAHSGAEAIEMVRLRQARRQPYNLILIDWKMPEMDGVETTRRIRAIVENDSAIIILTAYRWDDVLDEALSAGVDSFIPKPLFAAQVLDEFRNALSRRNIIANAENEKAELSGRTVLLAEDMPINSEIMIMVLEMRGIKAELAENGREAVEMYTSRPEGYFDAILMDMRMPEMDGLEATRRIRASGRADSRDIPIIALTANAFDEDVQHSLQAGLNAHLSKPVQPDVLFETLESLIKD